MSVEKALERTTDILHDVAMEIGVLFDGLTDLEVIVGMVKEIVLKARFEIQKGEDVPHATWLALHEHEYHKLTRWMKGGT